MSKLPNEIQTQKAIISLLEEHDLFPFNVLCTLSNNSGGMVSITFYLPSDLKEFLDLIEYKVQCDKSGYEIIEDTNTVILQDIAFINLYSML